MGMNDQKLLNQVEGDAFKSYVTPHGKIRYSQAEFDVKVEHFRELAKQRDQIKSKTPTRTLELNK